MRDHGGGGWRQEGAVDPSSNLCIKHSVSKSDKHLCRMVAFYGADAGSPFYLVSPLLAKFKLEWMPR